LIAGTKLAAVSLEESLKTVKPGPLFNNAEQHYNHSFYWKSLSPKGGGEPKGSVVDAIKKSFGHFEAFKKNFSEVADAILGAGGPGWCRRKTARCR
jgi:superoxide dismutase, Fe-Mn family